jgi:hypothetical protein
MSNLLTQVLAQTKKTPVLNYADYDYEALGDDDTKHLWRAHWRRGYGDQTLSGILLSAYPVVKHTEHTALICQDAYYMRGYGGGTTGWEIKPWMKTKRVYIGSNQSWAKQTRKEAIDSLAIRLTRWANNVSRDVRKVVEAAEILAELSPENAFASEYVFGSEPFKNLVETRS